MSFMKLSITCMKDVSFTSTAPKPYVKDNTHVIYGFYFKNDSEALQSEVETFKCYICLQEC